MRFVCAPVANRCKAKRAWQELSVEEVSEQSVSGERRDELLAGRRRTEDPALLLDHADRARWFSYAVASS